DHGRELGEAGVVGALVDGVVAVEGLPGLSRAGGLALRRELVVDVGGVVAVAVRPAVVAGLLDEVELDLATGAAVRVRRTGVRPVVTEVDPAGLLVDGEAEGVAEAHPVDLRPRQLRAGREEVPLGDLVGAARA